MEHCYCRERELAPPTRIEQVTRLLAIGLATVGAVGLVAWLIWIREPYEPPPPPEHPAARNFTAIAEDGEGGTVYRVRDGENVCYFYRGSFRCTEKSPGRFEGVAP